MLIDWFTVFAQLLNFLILVWLMKRFLYKPILNAVDEREKRIAKELADADAKMADAEKKQDEFQHKNDELEQQRAALMSKATDQAAVERERLFEESRKAAVALSAKLQEKLNSEETKLHQSIRRQTQQEVFWITRKLLSDLATASLEERLCSVFIGRLRGISGEAKSSLGQALEGITEPALVRSAFDLPVDQREEIQKAINETFSAEIELRFETAPELVSGIEISTNGQKLAWSISDYLDSLQESVELIITKKEKSETKVQPKREVEKSEGVHH